MNGRERERVEGQWQQNFQIRGGIKHNAEFIDTIKTICFTEILFSVLIDLVIGNFNTFFILIHDPPKLEK